MAKYKYSVSKEWVLSHDEGEFDVAAGVPALDPLFSRRGEMDSTSGKSVEHFAFSSLVQLLRRNTGLSIERLAQKARVDVSELLRVEYDVHYEPKPRTVHQLACFFGLPEKKLLELSAVTDTQTPELKEAAVRFAANARDVMELNEEERHALAEFVKFLGSQ